MKRPLIIIISVVGIFLIVSLSLTRLMSPRVGNTFSTVSSGLGMGGGGGAPEVGMAPVPAEAPAYDAATDMSKSADAYNGVRQAVDGQAVQERLVIENADLAIVVKDPAARKAEISKLASDLGGYVVSSTLSTSSASTGKVLPEASIVIRVPSEKLDEALAAIKKGAGDVQYENRSGQDVTNAYVDLQAQLKAKEAADKKLLEIMDKAEKSEDVLAIYMQIQSVETEIEQLKGQIKYYEESAALSSISVRLIAEEATQPIQVGPWKPQGTVKAAIEDLGKFAQNFADFLIYLVISVVPSLIMIAIPLLLVFLGGRALYRRFWRPGVRMEDKDVKG